MVLPPATDTLHRQGRRVVILPPVDDAPVLQDVVDPVGDRFPIRQTQKVVDVDRDRLPRGLPLPPVVLEVPEQFLLLAVDRNDRLPLLLALRAVLLNVGELGCAGRLAHPCNGIVVSVARMS